MGTEIGQSQIIQLFKQFKKNQSNLYGCQVGRGGYAFLVEIHWVWPEQFSDLVLEAY
jgi:hypothetical protein